MQIHQFLCVVRHFQRIILHLEVFIRMDQALTAVETNTVRGHLLSHSQHLRDSLFRHIFHFQHTLTAEGSNQCGRSPVTSTLIVLVVGIHDGVELNPLPLA